MNHARLPRSRVAAMGAAMLLAALALAPRAALAASCDGVPEWNAGTIYHAGDRLVKSSTLYQAKQDIWNAPPDHPAGAPYYDNLGACDGGGGGDNVPPSVTLTSPANGASFAEGSSVAIGANASDSDGSIVRVEFFRGTTSLGTDTSAPYGIAWTAAGAGSHVFKAVATDDDGATTTSATVSITVTGNGGGDDCYAAWSSTTAYTQGNRVTRNGRNYEAKWWTQGEDPAQSGQWGPWKDLGACEDEPPPDDDVPPSVPTGLNSPSQTASSISLSWDASVDNASGSGVAGYDVYRDGNLVGSPVSTSYTDTGLAADTAHSYAVRARDNAGNASVRSPEIVASTRPDDGGGGGDKRVIGYFTQWGIYGRGFRVQHIESSGAAQHLTHINYAFGNVRNNRCEVGVTQPSDPNTGAGGDAFADYTKAFSAAESVDGVADTWDQPLRGNWNQLKKLKAMHPGLKVLISLGGWTWSRGFSEAARPENRVAFVASCIDAYIRGNLPVTDGAGGAGAAAGVFDGIDIDWEYPVACGLSCGTPEDNANFTALLAEFRRQLDAVRPGLLLTIAAGAGIDKIRVTDPRTYHQSLDYINVMTYDFHGTWDPQTNHHSALFDSPADPSTGDQRFYNSNDAIEAFLARGVPAHKLNLGIGYYGRGWTGVANVNNGLYQSGTPAPGTYEAGNEDWKVLKNRPGTEYLDAQARATWKYDGNTFWSYDTPAMIAEKMQYVQAQGLGGAFFWEFSGDDASGTLTRTIGEGLD